MSIIIYQICLYYRKLSYWNRHNLLSISLFVVPLRQNSLTGLQRHYNPARACCINITAHSSSNVVCKQCHLHSLCMDLRCLLSCNINMAKKMPFQRCAFIYLHAWVEIEIAHLSRQTTVGALALLFFLLL